MGGDGSLLTFPVNAVIRLLDYKQRLLTGSNASVYFDGLKIKKLQFFDANNFVKIKTFRIFAT